MSKLCTACGLDKPSEDYYRDSRSAHGLTTQCKLCMNDRKRAKRAADPEAARAGWRQDYQDHKDRYTRAAANYQERNRERFLEWSRHNSNKRRVGVSSLTGGEFYEWVSAQDKTCAWCNADCTAGFQVDHVIPLSRGGEHEISNFAISCAPCNRAKGSMLPSEFQAHA